MTIEQIKEKRKREIHEFKYEQHRFAIDRVKADAAKSGIQLSYQDLTPGDHEGVEITLQGHRPIWAWALFTGVRYYVYTKSKSRDLYKGDNLVDAMIAAELPSLPARRRRWWLLWLA